MESSFMSGKGDKKRQLKVSYETYAKNWDLIFKKNSTKKKRKNK